MEERLGHKIAPHLAKTAAHFVDQLTRRFGSDRDTRGDHSRERRRLVSIAKRPAGQFSREVYGSRFVVANIHHDAVRSILLLAYREFHRADRSSFCLGEHREHEVADFAHLGIEIDPVGDSDPSPAYAEPLEISWLSLHFIEIETKVAATVHELPRERLHLARRVLHIFRTAPSGIAAIVDPVFEGREACPAILRAIRFEK